MMTLRQFGRMCFRMILPEEAPIDLAARTYSFCLICKICPLTSLAMPTQYRRAKTMNIDTILVPSPPISGILEKFPVSRKTTDNRMMISKSGRE